MEIPQLEILFIIIFSIIALFSILAYTNKMSVGIALLSMFTGIAIAWIFAPFMQLVINPIGNFIAYGYPLSLTVITSFYLLFALTYVIIVAGYNQIVSDGEITWA